MSPEPEPRSWSQMPWLDMRAYELSRTTEFDRHAVYRAARALFMAGLPDHEAANLLVSADSLAGHSLGIETFVENVIRMVKTFGAVTVMKDSDWPGGQEL